MLLTVVVNGHNCVATARAGNAQGRIQDFTLVATEAERWSIFSQKVDDLFLAVVHKTLLYWIKQALRPNKASFFRKKNPLNRRLGPWSPWSLSGYAPGNATQHAVSVATQRHSVRVNTAAASALLMTVPRTGRLLTIWLLLWETQVSKHASMFML